MGDNGGFSFSARVRSFGFAFQGIAAAFRSQHNMWIHVLATLVVCGLGWMLQVSSVEWCLLLLAITSVFTAELFNTAFEALCDVASPDYHPMVRRAKDVSAGAVLASAIGAALVGAIVFGPRLAGFAG